ncbi:biotinidase [Pristis pectinata]|uniref:biotinidase n=1 Tax=Pristis pectinata TaxID=685728 RepID=UPI00223D4AD1|nr:biotinidase [Pristis pectinata]
MLLASVMEIHSLKWLLLVCQCCAVVCGLDVYTAAVYEHRSMLNPRPKIRPTRQAALKHMKKNLDIYQMQVYEAGKQGAKIIVFPESGLYGFNFTRDSIFPYLEPIPDPTVVTWNPCLHPRTINNTEVLYQLSCMAKNGKMYLIANMGERQTCEHSDPWCPSDGRYQFNTDVIFDAEGSLIAKYHKQNLYFEDAFNTPKTVEHVIFNTSFAGRFGVFTCFDILFYDPAVSLIENYGVKQIVFPTAWNNQLPLLSAVELQQAFATAFSINLLAANQHHTERDMTGSGIYTPSLSRYYYDMESSEGKLLVAEVPIITHHNVHSQELKKLWVTSEFPERYIYIEASAPQLQERRVKADQSQPLSRAVVSQMDGPGDIFHALMMYDNYTFVLVTGLEGNLQVCSNTLCCHLAYQRSHKTRDLYAFGAFDGLHTVHGTYYLQVCALVKCAGSSIDTCGQSTTAASDIIDFKLWGNFSTRHIYTEILATEVKLYHADTTQWVNNNFYMTKQGMSEGLVTAALYGRWYKRDQLDKMQIFF